MGGLAASRWAPKLTSWPVPPPPRGYRRKSSSSGVPFANPPAPVDPGQQIFTTPQKEFSRFLKITARMKWKLPFLEQGYMKARDRENKTPQDIAAAEIHFKIDFHEFYMLIERAIIHLLGVYGVTVSPSRVVGNNGMGMGMGVGVMARHQNQHRFHENVLLALEDSTNPLHNILGQEPARSKLWRAKDLRNQWKAGGVADDPDGSGTTRCQLHSIELYNLHEIIGTILAGIEQAYFVTDQFVRAQNPQINQGHPVSPADWATDSEDWEFMVDAMDWEAV